MPEKTPKSPFDQELIKSGTGAMEHGANYHVLDTDGKTIIKDSMEDKNRQHDQTSNTDNLDSLFRNGG